MRTIRIIRIVLGCLMIGCAVVWSTMFPKTTEILKPDFVLSVAVGLGLAASGVFCLLLTKRRAAVLVLSTLLLWSALSNVALLAHMRAFREFAADIPAMDARAARYYLDILESDREDATERLSSILKDTIKRSEDMSGAFKR